MNGIAFNVLQYYIIQSHGKDSDLAIAVGKDYKGKLSVILYIIAVVLTKYNVVISGVIYILVALLWLIPDKRIEKTLKEKE